MVVLAIMCWVYNYNHQVVWGAFIRIISQVLGDALGFWSNAYEQVTVS
jgi:hypothetical protein